MQQNYYRSLKTVVVFEDLSAGNNPWHSPLPLELVGNIVRTSRIFTFCKYSLLIAYKFPTQVNPEDLSALQVKYDPTIEDMELCPWSCDGKQ